MQDKAAHSNIKLLSNIMIKSRYEKDPLHYLPVDLLPDYYVDVRAQRLLTATQRQQYEKKMYYAERIVDQ